jgi:capsular polysaccharide biosynthesis protein
MRPGDHIYGHWLVDILPKLVMVATYQEKDWLYLLANSTPSYAFELLSAFGIGREHCVLVDPNTQVVQARRLIISGALRQGNFMWPEARESFNRLKARFYDPSLTSPRRVYLKRPAHDPKRRLLNRSHIEGVFEAYEYQLVSPEKLTFREQFSLLARASVIAGEAGSALHSSVVADEGKVVELRSNADGSFIQAGLCESCCQDIGYFIGEAIARPGIGREASWIANRARLESYVREIAGDPHDSSA